MPRLALMLLLLLLLPHQAAFSTDWQAAIRSLDERTGGASCPAAASSSSSSSGGADCDIPSLLWGEEIDTERFRTDYMLRAQPVLLRNFTRRSGEWPAGEEVWELRDFDRLVGGLPASEPSGSAANGDAIGDPVSLLPRLPPVSRRKGQLDRELEGPDLTFFRIDTAPFPAPRAFQDCRIQEQRFAAGVPGGGLSWHRHDAVYHVLMLGTKHWLLAPPETDPFTELLPRRENATLTATHKAELLDFVVDLPRVKLSGSPVRACRQTASDVLYLPSFWHHATIHESHTLAVTTFCAPPSEAGRAAA